jgi:signal peptidase I
LTLGRTSPGSGRTSGSSLLASLIEVVVIVVAAFALALLIQQFLVKPFYIPSPSMVPTLIEGDRVLVNRLVYRYAEPERGDIVVFHPPFATGDDYIKRVVAVGGDTVEVREGRLYVNGIPQDEPYLPEEMDTPLSPEEVPAGHVFVMGDNRNLSGDSRIFGPVSEDELVGRAFLIYWPPTRLQRQ